MVLPASYNKKKIFNLSFIYKRNHEDEGNFGSDSQSKQMDFSLLRNPQCR